MSVRLAVVGLIVLGLVLPTAAAAQQTSRPLPPDFDPEALKGKGALDSVIYKKEAMEEYRKEVERQRRLRDMEDWDNQRRLVKRQVMNVQCTWSLPSGKSVTKVFKQRVAASCQEALEDLSQDLKQPLSADCTCTGTTPTAQSP